MIGDMEIEDLAKFNEMIDRLTVNKFFQCYRELRDYYEYLAEKYHFDLNTHTLDPVAGEIVPIKKDRVYFDKMA